MKPAFQAESLEQFYVEALSEYHSGPHWSVFLAGGITGCPDWQAEVRHMLDGSGIVLVNPRRVDFPMGDPTAAEAQIRWEFVHLEIVDAILFWFCAEQVQPIALFELGRWSYQSKPIFVGVHPDYPRRQDVEVQLSLVNTARYRASLAPIRVVHTLEDLADQVRNAASKWRSVE